MYIFCAPALGFLNLASTLCYTNRATYFPVAERADRMWEYLNRSQNMDVGIGTEATQFHIWEYFFFNFLVYCLCSAV
jgi:hypothetical protein